MPILARSIPFAVTAAVSLLLVTAGPAPAQDTCDVAIAFNDVNATALVAFGLDYSGAGGSIIGDSSAPSNGPSWGTEFLACTPAAAEFYDAVDDNAGLLSVFLANSQTSWVGTVPLITCVLALDGGFPCPDPADFVFVDPDFPDDPIPPPLEFPPLPGLSVASVTQRAPVCGDGFLEGTEECDDGDVVDGDCCSSTCALDAAGAPCDIGVCTLDETCDASGTCVAGGTLVCDDGLFCTYDQCDPIGGCFAALEPNTTCDTMSRGSIDIRDSAMNDAKDRVKFKSRLHRGDIGDPTVATDYALCIFDEVDRVSVLVDRIEVPAAGPWVELGSGKFRYIDRLGTVEGVQKFRLQIQRKTNGTRSKVFFQARGENLTLPGPFSAERYLARDKNVHVQLENSDGSCWLGQFNYKAKHKPDRYKAKH